MTIARILIADDHAIVRQGLRTFLDLQDDMEVVGEASNGAEAVSLTHELDPDVVLMDLVMPGEIDGVEATAQVTAQSPRSRVIVVTSFHDDAHVFPAMRAGALSYLLKSARPEDLVHAIRQAISDEAVVHPDVAARLARELRGPASAAPDPFRVLTERELEVLGHIAEGRSNAEIAERLVLAVKTVRTHVSNILGKLHLRDRTQAAIYAWKHGVVRKHDT